jgi:phosphatidylcholine synthase
MRFGVMRREMEQGGGASQLANLDGRRLAALGVHGLTASGAALGLLALMATLNGRFDHAFLYLGVALVIDGIDGFFARKADVDTYAPRFDGALLDLVVDYTTYVLVPIVMLLKANVFPGVISLALSLLIAVSAALYFADRNMKTGEGWFRGFPALWNVVAFYLIVFSLPPWISAIAALLLVGAQFMPILVTHPMRVRRFRLITAVVIVLWAGAALIVTLQGLTPGLLTGALLIAGLLWVGLAGVISGQSARS